MSLKYAILGFLSLGPASGYDLKTRQFDESVAHFWPANQAQIYKTLDRMETDGWVTSEIEVQTGRPNRKEYRILPAGETALKTWLAVPRSLQTERRPFLVQLYFARHLAKAEVLTILENQLKLHREQLAQFQQIALPATEDPLMQRQYIFGGFTLDFGLRYEQMQIEWLEKTIADVQAMAEIAA